MSVSLFYCLLSSHPDVYLYVYTELSILFVTFSVAFILSLWCCKLSSMSSAGWCGRGVPALASCAHICAAALSVPLLLLAPALINKHNGKPSDTAL